MINCVLSVLFPLSLAIAQTDISPNPLAVFDTAIGLVTERFYDRTFRGLNWPVLVKDARAQLSSQSSDHQLKQTINGLLGLLRASHTEFLSRDDQEYWALKAVFSGDIDGAPHLHVGIWFDHIADKWFARSVFEGSPAYEAGLRAGDEIVSVNGNPVEPVRSFNRKQSVTVEFRRQESGPIQTLKLTPRFEGLQRTMLKASVASTRVLQKDSKKIGYFHLWAGTHELFKQALKNAAEQFAAAIDGPTDGATDGMILDLRDGFGGAYPAYLNPFFDHDEEGKPIPQIYSKPLVILINGGVRSGKEWLAYFLKMKKRGPLIGQKTRGYFLGGQFNEIVRGRFALYLAVVESPNLPRLEGIGVSPDIEVKQPFLYSANHDPQLEAALKALTRNN